MALFFVIAPTGRGLRQGAISDVAISRVAACPMPSQKPARLLRRRLLAMTGREFQKKTCVHHRIPLSTHAEPRRSMSGATEPRSSRSSIYFLHKPHQPIMPDLATTSVLVVLSTAPTPQGRPPENTSSSGRAEPLRSPVAIRNSHLSKRRKLIELFDCIYSSSFIYIKKFFYKSTLTTYYNEVRTLYIRCRIGGDTSLVNKSCDPRNSLRGTP